ncbi:RDD family protein [Streptomyces sp. NPDC087917]|uniref:RDD family protein n=1 Tax=Streptomyces sp. NPDC087917 TaxID=3155060 RepID=UPI00342A635C
MTASPGDGEHAAREGYYPDPSIPGYVRYWNGASWVPGTSRPAAPAHETGPVFLDQTSVTEALPDPAREPAALPDRIPEPLHARTPAGAGWQADPAHQAGFGGPRDVRVSWGGPAEPEARPALASVPAPAPSPAPAAFPAPAPSPAPAPGRPAAASAAPAGAPAAAGSRRLPAQASAESVGILSARPPAWPEPAGGSGSGGSGLTAAWPEAVPSAASAMAPAPMAPASPAPPPQPTPPAAVFPPAAPPAPAPAPPNRPEAPRPEAPRTEARRPEAPRTETPRPEAPRTERSRADVPAADPDAGRAASEPGADPGSRPRPEPRRTTTPRAVFERMAERAVRPAGFVRRGLARLVDSLVLGGVGAAVALPLVPRATAHVEAKVEAARAGGRTTTVWLLDATTLGDIGLVLGAVLLFGVFYEALPTARWGRTPGKKLFGVRVLATATLRPPCFGAALRRWLVYALLGLPGGLWCLVDRPRRQAWHDKAARTYVARQADS